MSIEHVAIIGAGVAGLTVALALAQRGIASTVIEQAAELTEVGAGLQLSPNATRILDRLGVLRALQSVWLEPESIRLRSGTRLSSIAEVPLGSFARERWQAPYGVLHRATLQKTLLAAVSAQQLCRLVTGQRIDSPSMEAFEAICGRAPDVVIGADGVWSVVRQRIAGAEPARFSGNIAWRMLLPQEEAPDFIERDKVTAFLGPASHLVAYPLKDSGHVNLVAIAHGRDPGKGWDHGVVNRTELSHAFRAWHPRIRAMIDGIEQPRLWPLYEMPEGAWSNSRDTILIGDAAHAVTPFAAQGAAMAIEDAYELALALAMQAPADAIRAFATKRKPRVKKIGKRGAFNRFVYHVRCPLALGRNLVLKLRPPHEVAADLDWIYEYRAEW